MHCISGILLLASVLALGQAAPVNSKAQFIGPYQGPFNELNKLAKKQWSVRFRDQLAKLESFYPRLIDGLAKEQWAIQLDQLAKQESVNPGSIFRALGGVMDSFNQPQGGDQLAKQESVNPGSIFRALGGMMDSFNQPQGGKQNFGDTARSIGDLIGAFNNYQANQETVANRETENKETETNVEDMSWGDLAVGLLG